MSCSARHTLITTTTGQVYSSGDGVDGALGHGDPNGTSSLRLIVWFAEKVPAPDMVSVSCAYAYPQAYAYAYAYP